MNLSPRDRDAMIRTIWGESRGEVPAGREAVAHVILNRASNPAWWGGTPFDVCHKKYQFSCWNAFDPNAHKIEQLCQSDDLYQEIGVVVDHCARGLVPDPTNGADHYKVTGTHASWDVDTTGKDPVVIGHHSFWKLGPRA